MRAQTEFGEVTGPGSATNTLGKDWPFVFGNVFAICGGGVIAIIGSLIDEPKILKSVENHLGPQAEQLLLLLLHYCYSYYCYHYY